jgi:DNA-directed RNA polymerase beta subunit
VRQCGEPVGLKHSTTSRNARSGECLQVPLKVKIRLTVYDRIETTFRMSAYIKEEDVFLARYADDDNGTFIINGNGATSSCRSFIARPAFSSRATERVSRKDHTIPRSWVEFEYARTSLSRGFASESHRYRVLRALGLWLNPQIANEDGLGCILEGVEDAEYVILEYSRCFHDGRHTR